MILFAARFGGSLVHFLKGPDFVHILGYGILGSHLKIGGGIRLVYIDCGLQESCDGLEQSHSCSLTVGS